MHDPAIHPSTPESVKIDFEEALKKRTELKRIFRKLNIVIQKVSDTYILEIQFSTIEERNKITNHPKYEEFAPFVTLEPVGVKKITDDTAEQTGRVIDFFRWDKANFIEGTAIVQLAEFDDALPPWLKGKILHVNHANREADLFRGQRFALQLVVDKKQAAMRILKDAKLQSFLPFLHLKVETKNAA